MSLFDTAVRRMAADEDSVTRTVGAMAALGGLVLLPAFASDIVATWADAAWWWNLGGLVLAVLTVVLGVGTWFLPMRALRITWSAFPLLMLALVVTWPLARLGGPETATPWVWQMEPLAVGVVAVAWPLGAAVAFALVAAPALPVALLLADGAVADDIVVRSVIHLGNVVFIALFVLLRRSLRALWRSEQVAARQAAHLASTEAWSREESRMAAMIHDEVLATLASTMHTHGPVPEILARQADRALAALGEDDVDSRTLGPPDGGVISPAHLVALVRSRAEAAGASVRVLSEIGGPSVPQEVAGELVAACDEALRNLRHAVRGRVDVRREVRARVAPDGVTITVADDGAGFDPAGVGAARLGIRRSIVGRMDALPGGSSAVESEPGRGTSVTLRWVRP